MRHIVSAEEKDNHEIEDHQGAICKCLPEVRINRWNGDLYVVHKSFNLDFIITEDDLEGIFDFAHDDPEYDGGSILVYENDSEEDTDN